MTLFSLDGLFIRTLPLFRGGDQGPGMYQTKCCLLGAGDHAQSQACLKQKGLFQGTGVRLRQTEALVSESTRGFSRDPTSPLGGSALSLQK